MDSNLGANLESALIQLGILQDSNKAKRLCHLNPLSPRQNGRHFADDFLKHIFLNENV